jgi:hypothetical protein
MADEVVATRDIDKELGFTRWVTKVTERLNIVLLCIKERQDKIQESDYDILKAMHGVWFFGEVPIYETITIPDIKKMKQASLFDSITEENVNVSDNFDDMRNKILDGTVIDSIVTEPIK